VLPLNVYGSTKIMKAQVQLEYIEVALYKFCCDVKRFPSTEEGLNVLVEKQIMEQNWNGPYISNPNVPFDPWGNKFIYLYPTKLGSERFDLYSVGSNGKDDKGDLDDISIWKEYDDNYYRNSFDPYVVVYIIILLDFPVALIGFILWKRIRKSI
jgi:general secretion pathway protein G